MNLVTLELDGFIIIVLYISLDYYIIGDTIILHNIGSLVISEPFYLDSSYSSLYTVIILTIYFIIQPFLGLLLL